MTQDGISVIIPTYKEPEYLRLCLESIFESQDNEHNQIIVVVDGYYDINKDVLENYSGKMNLNILNFEENQGLSIATNYGVYSAIYDKILIVNDDNVFCKDWDLALMADYKPGRVISPNQIEPNPSMFQQFHIKDLGTDYKKFNLGKFFDYELSIRSTKIDDTGCTLPIFMNKYDFIRVGGWDIGYPSAHVVDWDFFLKCELSKMEMVRSYKASFYHFAGQATRTPEEAQKTHELELQGHEYFRYKWGQIARHNKINNSKMIDVPYLLS